VAVKRAPIRSRPSLPRDGPEDMLSNARDYPEGYSGIPPIPLWILLWISRGSPEGSPLPGQIVRAAF